MEEVWLLKDQQNLPQGNSLLLYFIALAWRIQPRLSQVAIPASSTELMQFKRFFSYWIINLLWIKIEGQSKSSQVIFSSETLFLSTQLQKL